MGGIGDWWQEWKDREFQHDLERDAARDVDRHGRQPWGPSVEEVVERHPDKTRHDQRDSGRLQRRGRGGKAGASERSRWRDDEYDAARRDYQWQNRWRQEADQRSYEQRRAAEDVRAAQREATDRARYRDRDPPPDSRSR